MGDKSLFVMETPKNCDACIFSQIAHNSDWFKDGECYCLIKLESVVDILEEDRPDWCPLKPVPGKKNKPKIKRIRTMSESRIFGFCSGWNVCIDKITGGDE